MDEITSRDLTNLQSMLRKLYAIHDLESFRRVSARIAERLIGGDSASYNEVDPIRRRSLGVVEPVQEEPRVQALSHVFDRYLHQHPVLCHYRSHPNDGPKKISDFLADDEFQRLELYREFYGPVGINYQIVAHMPASFPLNVAITVNRTSHDFSERERTLLSLLQPHLRQAYENAVVVTNLQSQVKRVQSALDQLHEGVLFIDRTGRILHSTPAASNILATSYPGSRDSHSLPKEMTAWAQEQMAALDQAGGSERVTRTLSLTVTGDAVVARLVRDKEDHAYAITFRHSTPPRSAAPLYALGLTKRQAEILLQLALGKRNQQISDELHISVRTVHKHLENIYAKIGVTSRNEAIAKALEWLRI